MKSLVLFRYNQPAAGPSFRWGVLQDTRDTKREPLAWSTIIGPYRKWDKNFKRTRNLDYVKTTEGVKAFYRERESFRVRIPFLGSIAERMLPAKVS